jgi:hypothetical protein
MHSAKVVKVTNLGATVQLLCVNNNGLSSVYLEYEPFSLLRKAIRKAGVAFQGLQVRYDRNRLHVPSLGKTWISHAVL